MQDVKKDIVQTFVFVRKFRNNFSTVTKEVFHNSGTISDMMFIHLPSPTNHRQAVNAPRSGYPCASPGWTQLPGHTQNYTHTRRLHQAPLPPHSELLLRLQR